MAYVARNYTPAQGLVMVHGTVRVGGSNVITTQDGSEIFNRQGAAFEYAIGVLVPAIIMIIVFIIWLFSLCFAKICCKGCCGKNVALVIFVSSCMLSLVGWAIGLAGNVSTTQGFNAMINGVSAVQGVLNQVIGISEGAANYSNSMFALAENMQTSCSNPNVSFPFDGIADGLNQTINSAVGDDGLGKTLQGYNDQINTYKSLVQQYLNWREVGTLIVIVVTMVVLAIFMVTTALRVMESTPEACRPCLRCSSRSASCIVFLFGILLLLIIWIFIAIIHVIVTVGADFCVPSPNYNINRLANEVINKTFSTVDPCTIDGYQQDSTAGILCYYQTCQGANKLDTLTGPIATNTNGSSQILDNFATTLQNFTDHFNVTVLPDCFPSINSFTAKAGDIFGLVDSALNITTCPNINPVYATFLYDGFCNGLVDGLVLTYVSCIMAMVFMMLAMSIFRIFDFQMYEYGRLPEAYYVDAKEGQVLHSGGPITQPV